MLNRREALVSVAAVGLTQIGCTTIPKGLSQEQSFGDAHVHLFNMADLPAGNFLRYVFFPEKFSSAPGWAAAVADLVGTALRSMTVTASAEAAQLRSGLAVETISPGTFGKLVANHISARLRPSLTSPDEGGLKASYIELARELSGGGARLKTKSNAAEVPTPEEIADIAEAAESEAGLPTSTLKIKGFGMLGAAKRVIGWSYLMMLSRSGHTERFLRRSARTGRVSLLINHLVDYDYWLDESPASGSDMLAQVEVMDLLRTRYRDRVDMRLFAGFDPLKLAIESTTGKPTTLSRLLTLHRQGKVHGFKIYPPMGFQPWGNTSLPDSAFDPGPGRRTALDRWKAAGGAGGLGAALDRTLKSFYAVCADRRIPIMAHAARSNGAGPAYRDRANPLYWQQVTANLPLRLTLGHVVDNVERFIWSVKNDNGPQSANWALRSAVPLMDPTRPGAMVYGDIGYTEELLASSRKSAEFFRALRDSFGQRDPEMTRILFGSDWIMLGVARNNEFYLEAVLRGMHDARYSEQQKRNILENNLRRALA